MTLGVNYEFIKKNSFKTIVFEYRLRVGVCLEHNCMSKLRLVCKSLLDGIYAGQHMPLLRVICHPAQTVNIVTDAICLYSLA